MGNCFFTNIFYTLLFQRLHLAGLIDLEAKYFQCYLDNSHVAGNYECHGGVPPSQGRGKYFVQMFSLLFS